MTEFVYDGSFAPGDRVEFREEEISTATPLVGTVRWEIEPNESYPHGGEYEIVLDHESPQSCFAWKGELTKISGWPSGDVWPPNQKTLEELLAHFGTAKALFNWAGVTQTDIRSAFDLPDEDFDTLKTQVNADNA